MKLNKEERTGALATIRDVVAATGLTIEEVATVYSCLDKLSPSKINVDTAAESIRKVITGLTAPNTEEINETE